VYTSRKFGNIFFLNEIKKFSNLEIKKSLKGKADANYSKSPKQTFKMLK
jgi:hypothetical protein